MASTQRDFSEMTEVRGLKELQRELRNANPEMAKRLQIVNKRLVETVAAKARAAFYKRVDDVSPSIRTGPARNRRSKAGISRARDSIKASASGREARIRAGGARVPSFFGFEFGGSRGLGATPGRSNRGPRVRTRQFPVHRGKQGYVLYPTVRAEREHAFKDWNNLFDEIMRRKDGPS